ncbi:uncharacterized protein METZ01_LOCUS70507 [marine metagenome]|uniref:Uncharacterized protein n=1 Tax=marine metagenome TaxID=408172 RepID=A0A381TUA8_9ZZZZ
MPQMLRSSDLTDGHRGHGGFKTRKSGKRDSNPRPPAWKAGALSQLSYSRPNSRMTRKLLQI